MRLKISGANVYDLETNPFEAMPYLLATALRINLCVQVAIQGPEALILKKENE